MCKSGEKMEQVAKNYKTREKHTKSKQTDIKIRKKL